MSASRAALPRTKPGLGVFIAASCGVLLILAAVATVVFVFGSGTRGGSEGDADRYLRLAGEVGGAESFSVEVLDHARLRQAAEAEWPSPDADEEILPTQTVGWIVRAGYKGLGGYAPDCCDSSERAVYAADAVVASDFGPTVLVGDFDERFLTETYGAAQYRSEQHGTEHDGVWRSTRELVDQPLEIVDGERAWPSEPGSWLRLEEGNLLVSGASAAAVSRSAPERAGTLADDPAALRVSRELEQIAPFVFSVSRGVQSDAPFGVPDPGAAEAPITAGHAIAIDDDHYEMRIVRDYADEGAAARSAEAFEPLVQDRYAQYKATVDRDGSTVILDFSTDISSQQTFRELQPRLASFYALLGEVCPTTETETEAGTGTAPDADAGPDAGTDVDVDPRAFCRPAGTGSS